MTPNKLETSILALLKTNKVMLRRDIRAHFGLSNIQMNKISSRLRQADMVVSSATGALNRWYDKEYADSQGIKSSKRESKSFRCNIDKAERPYLDRMSRIDSFWRMAV